MYQQIKQLDKSGISKFESHRHEMEEEIQKEGKEGSVSDGVSASVWVPRLRRETPKGMRIARGGTTYRS